MARPKSAKPQENEQEEDTQNLRDEEMEDEDQDENEEQEEPTQSKGSISKAKAARMALAEGYSSPGDAVEFIRKRFGIEMDKQHFSAVKSQFKKRESEARSSSGKGWPTRKNSIFAGYPSPTSRSSASGGETDVLNALEAMKPLVEQYGAEKLKRIVDLLG